MATDREQLFPAKRANPQAKAATTDNAARLIVAAETAAREKKTAKLKALRLEQPPAPAVEAPPSRKRAQQSK